MNAKRDWGFAPEYVEMMWLMLQQNSPDDYVVGTGNSYSVREFVEKAFRYAGIELEWKGSGKDEKGIISSRPQTLSTKINTGDIVIEIDQKYFRPTEVEYLKADITKAKTRLRWEPRITFDELVKIMVDYDMKILGLEPPREGIEASRNKGFSYTNHDFSLYEKIREGC